MVIGKGAAFGQAEAALREFVQAAGLPFLATAMGRGVVRDDSPLCVNAARSMALAGADVAVIFGARWAGAGAPFLPTHLQNPVPPPPLHTGFLQACGFPTHARFHHTFVSLPCRLYWLLHFGEQHNWGQLS